MQPTSNARRAFWALVVLTGGGVGLLALLVVWQAPLVAQGVWLACQDALSAVNGFAPAIGLALPVALLAIGLVRLVRALALQLWYTRLIVADMTSKVIAPPANVATVAVELDLGSRLVVVEDGNAYTFAQGLWRPRIWLTTGLAELLDEAELRAVLKHERYHVQQRDPLRVLISRSLADALFFVPVAKALRDTYLAAKEMEADVASAADDVLAGALVKLLRSGQRLPDNASLAAIGPFDVTRARIQRLVHQEPGLRFFDVIRLRHILVSMALAAALLITSYASTIQAAEPLAGGECGYRAAPQSDMTPINYTPAAAQWPRE